MYKVSDWTLDCRNFRQNVQKLCNLHEEDAGRIAATRGKRAYYFVKFVSVTSNC
jgi:hypothetical protein